MFYHAICIDNSKFLEKGTIRVRVFAHFNYPRTKGDETEIYIDDLSKNPDLIALAERSESDYDDLDAQVFTPLGGGRNFGMLYLPQVNAKGLVTYIDENHLMPLWVGSYFEARHNLTDYDKIEYVNAPSDVKSEDGTNKDAFADGVTNFQGDVTDTLVIRTKHTVMNKSDGAKMDFEQQDTENLILINKNEATIRHYSKWDNGTPKQYQDISIETFENGEPKIIIKFKDEDDNKSNIIYLTKDDILLESDDGSSPISTINIKGGDGITFIDDTDNLVTYKDLKEIVDKIEAHKHVRFPATGSDGLTGEPVLGQGTPFKSEIITPKRDMCAILLKAHPKGK
jgi:hypothetical protein